MKKFQGGGGVPRQTTIGGQRHDLAYINPFEADLLRAYGGSGEPGPGGVPAYRVYNSNYNPSTISQDRTQNTASRQQAAMDREINRPASPSRPSSGQDNNPNRPSPAEQVARANAQANAERARNNRAALIAAEQAHEDRVRQQVAREQAAAADRQREQQMRAREAAAAEARRKQAEQSRREAAALAARNAARAEEERKEAARIAQAQEDARITKAREAARKAKVIASAPDSGGVTSVVGPAAEGPAEATGILSGLPNMLDMLKGAAGDVTMGYYAGFGDPATQRANLIAAGYSEAEAQSYLDRTAATIARNEAAAQGGTRSGDDSSPAPIDPCPEGYRMDTATNACVPSDDVTDAAPEPDPVTPFPGITPPISTVPTLVGSPNYTQIESPFTLPPLTPGGTPGILPMPDFGVAAADRGFMPTTYGGMPTDVDPFR